jgi:hypothetical protein
VNVCVATPHAVDTPTSPQWRNYGFADCAAILDITSAAFPTGLRQDPAIDVPVEDFKPKSDEDKRLQNLCKSSLWIGLITRWQPRAVGRCTYWFADRWSATRGRKGDWDVVQDSRCFRNPVETVTMHRKGVVRASFLQLYLSSIALNRVRAPEYITLIHYDYRL